MAEPLDTKIAGDKTVAHWQALSPMLATSNDPVLWKAAIDDFFRARLKTRYFDPIDTLLKARTYRGEGFSIVAIQCSLIEFLAATLEGKIYKLVPENQLGKNEYRSSNEMFSRFLATQTPFKAYFSEQLAREFYRDVRCALFHEARTRNRWRIRITKNLEPLDSERKVICPHAFQKLFLKYVDEYEVRLQHQRSLQDAFVRKFDSLCI